jgi:hypothetical protein
MIDQKLLSSLKFLYSRLNDPGKVALNWAVTGSLGMVLNGMEMTIHDIDLQTDKDGAFEIERRLLDYRVTPVFFKASDRIRSYFGIFEVKGVQVEVMGDMQHLQPDQVWQEPVKVEQFRKWITFENMLIPVMSLEHELDAYRLMGRHEKAERVREFLNK